MVVRCCPRRACAQFVRASKRLHIRRAARCGASSPLPPPRTKRGAARVIGGRNRWCSLRRRSVWCGACVRCAGGGGVGKVGKVRALRVPRERAHKPFYHRCVRSSPSRSQKRASAMGRRLEEVKRRVSKKVSSVRVVYGVRSRRVCAR